MKDGKLHYTCVLTTVEMMHLYKDPCSLAYYLAETGDWESTVVYFGSQEVHHAEFEKHVRLVYLGNEPDYKKKYKIAKRYLKEHGADIDIIMVFNYGKVSYGLSKTVKKQNPNAIAYCKLDMSEGGFEHFNAKTTWRKLMSIGELVKSRPIDLFTVESTFFYRELLKQRVFKGRLEYLPNGVSEVGADMSNLDGIKKEKIVVTIGRLGKYIKNNELLLEAIRYLYEEDASSLLEWKFVFAGPAEKDFFNKVEELRRELPGMADKIILTGNIDSRNEMYEICAKADIICMTSRSESFGIATVEGMYFGCCPVITEYGVVAHDQVPNDVPWGTVVAHDAHSVAVALRNFMLREDLPSLNNKVRQFAREKFNYRMLAEKLRVCLLRRIHRG